MRQLDDVDARAARNCCTAIREPGLSRNIVPSPHVGRVTRCWGRRDAVRKGKLGGWRGTNRPNQFRTVLRGISPLIGRRLLVRSGSTLANLHEVLQVAFGWEDVHLNRFEIRGREYSVYRDGDGTMGIDAEDVRLCDLHLRRLERFDYECVFGDGATAAWLSFRLQSPWRGLVLRLWPHSRQAFPPGCSIALSPLRLPISPPGQGGLVGILQKERGEEAGARHGSRWR